MTQPMAKPPSTTTVLETPHKGNGFLWVVHTVIDGFEGTGRHANKRAAAMLAEREAKDLRLLISAGGQAAADGKDAAASPISGHQIRKLRTARGRRTEWLVFQAFAVDYDDAPLWFSGVRRPDEQQDRERKIDVIVLTNDPAEVYLQIKTSEIGLRKFLASDPPPDVIGVVIHQSDSPAKIRARIFLAAWQGRRRLASAISATPGPRTMVLDKQTAPKHVPKRLLREKAGR